MTYFALVLQSLYVSGERYCIFLSVEGKPAPEARRALRSTMADQNTKIIFIWVNFGSRGFTKSPITNPGR